MKRLMGVGKGRARLGAEDRRRVRRATAMATLAVLPVVAMTWSAGCSDSTDGGGGNFVDPGGTFGAEITLTVVGRGRVTANLPGLDCPSDCFAKYVFSTSTADGAAGGLSLKAQPTPGATFKGWKFEAETIGSAGRGPEPCNPVRRPGAVPAVDTTALEINVPFGEVEGTSPPGQEASCAAFRKVPTVYKVTASFDTAVDAGFDAGSGEVVYEPTVTGDTALEMGMTNSGRLFWRYQAFSTGYQGIAYGDFPGGGTSQTPLIAVSPTTTISLFEVDPAGVAFQAGSSIGFIASSGLPTNARTLSPAGVTCYALAVDPLENVYCRTSTSIVRWTSPTWDEIENVFTSVPYGNDLHVDATSIFYTTTSGVYSLALSAGDGGVAVPTLVASASPATNGGLEGSASYLWWVQGSSLYACPRTGCVTGTNTGPFATGSITAARIAADTSSLYFWAATPTSIYRAYYGGGSSTQALVSGLPGVNGVAADASYVYWTQSDGTVRRAPKGI